MGTTAMRDDRTRGTTTYRAVWRWHFHAGLIIAPLLIVLALTGALYLFDREFDGWWNRDIATVTVEATTLSLAAQESAVRHGFPGADIGRVRLPRSAGEAAVWNIRRPDGTMADVYLDPHDGRITGIVDPSLQPMNVIREIHGELMAGDFGSYFVELTACWTLVMLGTGIWLWWPRRWKLRGVLVPRLATTGRRYWRDLHAIPAIFNAVLVILLVLSGLPWSVFWGPQFARIGATIPFVAPSPNFSAPPTAGAEGSVDAHAMHDMAAKPDPEAAKLPWTIRQMPTLQGSGGRAIGIADVERHLPMLARDRFGGGVRIFYPDAPNGVFTISYVPDKAEGQRTIHIDPGSGRILRNIGWSDYSPVAKAVEWGVMTHMGREYGLPNQLANLVVCLLLVGGVVAGMVLWWRRRAPGRLDAPALEASDRMPTTVKVMIGTIAILFPLVGASLVVIWAGGALRKALKPASSIL